MQRSSLPNLNMAMCVIFLTTVQCISPLRSEELCVTCCCFLNYRKLIEIKGSNQKFKETLV